MAEQEWKEGRTQDAAVAILKQSFWTKGTMLQGTVTRRFATNPEPGKTAMCFELTLKNKLTVDGSMLSSSEKLTGKQVLDRVGIGEMTGLQMALNVAGTEHVREGDILEIICTGSTDTGKGNPRTDFTVRYKREEKS